MKNVKHNQMSIAVFSLLLMLGVSCAAPAKKVATSKELFSSYFKPYNDDLNLASTVRGDVKGDEGGGSEEAAALKLVKANGLAAYKSKDYVGAMKFFEDYLSKNSTDLQVPFYYGIACLATSHTDKAEAQFSRLLGKPDAIYFEHSQWYMAMLYIEKGELQKSKDLLEKVVSNQRHYFNEPATELLGQVEYMLENGSK